MPTFSSQHSTPGLGNEDWKENERINSVFGLKGRGSGSLGFRAITIYKYLSANSLCGTSALTGMGREWLVCLSTAAFLSFCFCLPLKLVVFHEDCSVFFFKTISCLYSFLFCSYHEVYRKISLSSPFSSDRILLFMLLLKFHPLTFPFLYSWYHKLSLFRL